MTSVDIMSKARTKRRRKRRNVMIAGESVDISEKAVIEDNCKISATEIKIGDYAHIGKNVTISGEKIDIGEKAIIEDDCKILSKEFFIGWKSHIEKECSFRAIDVKKQKPMPLIYNEVKLDVGYRIDIFVENCIVVEIKSVDSLADIYLAQVLTYMKLSNSKLALLVNFNVKHLKNGIKRVIL